MDNDKPPNITEILNNNPNSSTEVGQVYGILYDDIKQIAHYHLSKMPKSNTLSPTVLVHEAYEKIRGSLPKQYNDRAHFLRSLGLVIRNYLIDNVRAKNSSKSGQRANDMTLSDLSGDLNASYEIIDIDRALTIISEINEDFTQILELRILFGFTLKECSEIIKMSYRQTVRRWKQAQTLLISLIES